MTVAATVLVMGTRRRHGMGSLYERNGAWYGHWRSNGRQVKRKLGVVRVAGSKAGLTRSMAERELGRRISETVLPRAVGERLNVEQVSDRYRLAAERKGRKRSTVMDIESHTRVHLEPFFGARALDGITAEDVQDLVGALEHDLAPKTVRNIIGTLSALFNFAKLPRNQWAGANPCEGVDLPADVGTEEIRFLTLDQVDAVIAHARPKDYRQTVDLQSLDRALYLTAAMTGLRLGELLALRWQDVDWSASKVRVRQNYVRGEFGTPKSKRSTRSVPMADAAAGELDRLFQASGFQDNENLVFAHPQSGEALAKANVTRRFKKALTAAGITDEHVFHDLRHTFGTRCAAAGVAMRTLQEWMGHRDLTTTMRYSDYSPSVREADMIAGAFTRETTKEMA